MCIRDRNNSPPPQSVRSHRRAPLFRKGGRRIQGPPADKRGEHCPFWDQRQKGGKNAAAGCRNRGKQVEKPVARALVERGRQQVPPSPPPQPIIEMAVQGCSRRPAGETGILHPPGEVEAAMPKRPNRPTAGGTQRAGRRWVNAPCNRPRQPPSAAGVQRTTAP